MSGLYEVTEESMVVAYQAGATYWKRNKPYNATHDNLASLARSTHWHDGDNYAWLAGFYEAKSNSLSELRDAIRQKVS